jgi:acyl-coenzyme A thioesterase PaaI-like protein
MLSKRGKTHSDCIFCGKDGFILTDYKIGKDRIESCLTVEKKHEGWPGIPHGGIAMTTMMEMADLFDCVTERHPITANFRFGGDAIATGDRIDISLIRENRRNIGEVKRPGRSPYLKCEISHPDEMPYREEINSIREILRKPVKNTYSFVLPDFVNRILYSREYQTANRFRIFELREMYNGNLCIVCSFRDSEGRPHSGELNRISDDQIHPGPLITILDETLGWSGFLTAWEGGITIELTVCFLRPVKPDEIIFSIGKTDRIHGLYKRKIVTCSGCIFSVNGDDLEPVVFSTGRWLIKPGFREKMIKYLPPDKNPQMIEIMNRYEKNKTGL